MKPHSSEIFQFDKNKTEHYYRTKSVNSSLPSEVWKSLISKIKKSVKNQDLNIGINYDAPREEIDSQYFYQIEYLFVGKINDFENSYIPDANVGINILKEDQFGQKEFMSEDILNLIFIIEK